MKQLKPILLGILAVCFFSNSHAQYNKVLAASNFGGVSNVSYNPAIADNRLKFDLNLISLGLEVNNNYLGISNQPLLHRDYFKDDKFADKYLIERINGKTKKAFIGMDAQIPLSFMFAWGKNRSNKNAIALTANMHSISNVDNISETLARSSYFGLGNKADSITGFNFKNLSEKNVAIRNLEWMDIGATYSRVVYDKGQHFIKVGGTIKVLLGVASAYLYSNKADYQFNNYDSLNISTVM